MEELLFSAQPKKSDKLPTANFDQKIGIQIILSALEMLFFTIKANACMDGVIKLWESEILIKYNKGTISANSLRRCQIFEVATWKDVEFLQRLIPGGKDPNWGRY